MTPFHFFGLSSLMSLRNCKLFIIRDRLAKDPTFPHACLASLVASKVCFHAQQMEQALTYALRAGEHFDPHAQGPFTEAVVCKIPLR